MANSKISALTAATTPVAGTETLPIVQSSTTKQVSIANLTAGRAVSASSLTLTGSPLAVGSGGTGLTAVTATQILFGYTSGALSASSNFVYDYNNIRVGIGTNTPWSQASILTPSGGTEGYFGVKDSVFGGDVRFGKASGVNNNGIAGTWTNNDFLIYAAGTNTFTFDANYNLVQKVAAKGINFTANTGAAGMTSQLLNWYEEGTWTTTVTSTSNFTGTPTLDLALYTKVGRLVQIEGRFSGTVTTGSTLTYFVFTIPFNTSANASGATGTIVSNSGLKIGAVLDNSAAGAGQMLFMIPAQAAQPSGADTFFFSVTYAAA